MQRTVAIAACRRIMTFRRSSSAPPFTNNLNSRPSSSSQERGRSLTRRHSLLSHSSSVNEYVTNLIPIETTDYLKERNAAYQEQKAAPDDSKREWNKRMPEGTLIVYTDGSYKDGRCGFGIYMGEAHPLNRSQKILEPPHNNQRAEVLAVVQALKNILEWPDYNDAPVIVRTDALSIVQALNGQASQSCYAIEMEEIRALAGKIGGSVEFQHVYAHCNDPGNEAADELARQAVVGPTRNHSRSRARGEMGRSRSRSNDRYHIRTHSAKIQGSTSAA